jgi:Domain of Unknown Function (DUF1080)
MRFAVVLTMACVCGTARADEFVPLFNTKNLDGWKERQVGKGQEGRWSVADGILKAKAGSGWLGTEKVYGNFVLRVEWRIFENGNSGVFFRVPTTEFKGSPSEAGFEIQILDDNGPKYKGKLQPYQYSGGLYHFLPVSKQVFKGAGEWNSFELTVKGDKISLVYNGEKVIDADISTNKDMQKRPKKGYIGLQNHGSAVEFRRVEIRELE